MHISKLRRVWFSDPPPGNTPPAANPPANPPANQPTSIFAKEDTFEFVPGWQDKLPEELRPTAAKYQSLPALVKSYNELQKKLSTNSHPDAIKPPAADASDDDKTAFAKKLRFMLGASDKAEDYALQPAKAELKPYYEHEDAKAFLKMAHEKGWPKADAEAAVAWFAEKMAANDAKGDEMVKQHEKAYNDKLTEVFGAKKDQALVDAKRVVATIGSKDFTPDQLDVYPPELTIFLASLANSGAVSPKTLVSPEQFANKLSGIDMARDIQMNPNNPDHLAYITPSHPNHKAVVDRVLELNKQEG